MKVRKPMIFVASMLAAIVTTAEARTVLQILDMHDARLSISGEEGHGASFSCLFPASMTLQAGSESPAEEAS